MRRYAKPQAGRRGHSDDRHTGSDERGSIVMVLFIIITASILTLTAAGVAVSQMGLSRQAFQRTDGFEAAQAGLDVALADIRAANDGAGNGVLSKLPCNQLSGVPNEVAKGTVELGHQAQYTLRITYLTADPTGHTSDATWLSSHDVGCTSGAPSSVPSYALLSATGADPAAGGFVPARTVDETYYFRTTNANIAGGLIDDYQGTLCLADNAANGTPAAGDTLSMESCTVNSPLQTWAYRSDWTLVLTSTETATSAGLCLTQGSSSTTVSLTTCSDGIWSGSTPAGTPNYTQQWGVNDNGGLQTVSSSGGGPGSACLTTQDNPPVANDSLQLSSCSGGFTDNQTWLPSARVGAGDAGASTTQQFVNFQEFGRCIDVTNQNPTSGFPNGAGPGGNTPSSGGTGPGGFLIDYMCKQFPDTTNYPAWNQRFKTVPIVYNGTSYFELQTTDGSTTYCLWSPLDVVSSTTHAWAETVPCSSATTANVAWTVNYQTNNALTSYTLEDSSGNCLESNVADPQQPGGNGDAFSTIAVATCNGSYIQKWNAPPTLGLSGVNNAFEPSISGN